MVKITLSHFTALCAKALAVKIGLVKLRGRVLRARVPLLLYSRILKTKLGEHLQRELDENDLPKSALAARIGVSPQKLSAMLKDEWEYITRDALERAADALELDVEQIFEFVIVDFWRSIEESQAFLRGWQADTVSDQKNQVPRYDDQATEVVKDFMRKHLVGCDEPPTFKYGKDDIKEIVEKAKSQSCIVIGSPKTNAATEILLSSFFGADPFNPNEDNRAKIPFGFCWPENSPTATESSLTCSETARKRVHSRFGIAVAGGNHVEAHHKPLDEYHAWKTKEGLDAGLIFVANNPFGTNNKNKLIVLAGFAGIGTLAAAKALVQDFRYLEPVGDDRCVYGVVQAKYQKPTQKDARATLKEARELRSFRWHYRKGGHAPIG
jgi:DNA-binding Xre family transcriptional regulator